MYKCECGSVFSDPVFFMGIHDCEGYYACPNCHTERYAEAEKCEICGNYFFEHEEEVFGGACKSCLEEYKYDLELWLKIGEPIKEEVEISQLLTTVFSAKEIEEILTRELLQAHAIKKIDCTPFIQVDDFWAGEELVKEVNGK